MKIEDTLVAVIVNGVKDLYDCDIESSVVQLQKTRREFEGDLTLVVFPLLKLSKTSPENTAKQIGDWLKLHCDAVEMYNIVKGFLNITVSKEAWLRMLYTIDGDKTYGFKPIKDTSPLVMVEYSSPNTNKPLHLGHIRNNLLGWSLSKILEANGNRVVKTNIVNDRGIHICKSMLAWQKWGEGKTPESNNQKGDHLVGDFYVEFDRHYREEVAEITAKLISEGIEEEQAKKRSKDEAPLMLQARDMLIKWEHGDKEVRNLWQRMNEWVYAGFEQTYNALGISFDKIYYESQTYLRGKTKVEQGLKDGLFEKHEDGSVWADLTNEGLDKKILLRADGTSVYITQDIGTAEMRYQEYPIDKMIYVVGNEQNYHFQVLSILLDRLGYEWGKGLVHFSYGMVELPCGKMKSREGTVVDADELIEQMIEQAKHTGEELGKWDVMTQEERDNVAKKVGLGALKYFILKVDPKKNMLFNPEESIDFNGNTGPFIQYTYARIQSILRKATQSGINFDKKDISYLPNNEEKELIQRLGDYPFIVEQAGKDYAPSVIANYCYELTKAYNRFYHNFSILNAQSQEEKIFRLLLSKNVAKIIKSAMDLLGIEVPERM